MRSREESREYAGVRAPVLRTLYDHFYTSYIGREADCAVAIGSLIKAHQRITQILDALKLLAGVHTYRVLDLGCGLGFTTKAFRELGATVVGIDLSSVAIEQAQARFEEVEFRCAVFPEDLPETERFDLIWAVDLPAVGITDAQYFEREVLTPCLRRLTATGHVVIGWHTDLSGDVKNGWSHLSLAWIKELQSLCRASGVLIPQMRTFWLSSIVLYACRLLGRSVPVYFAVSALKMAGAAP